MHKMPRQFTGVYFERDLWLTHELTFKQKAVFVEINSLDNENGCFATNQHFATFLNVSVSRARRIIDSLVQLGYVSRETGNIKIGDNTFKRVLRIAPNPWIKPINHMAKNSHTHMAKNSHTHMAKNSHTHMAKNSHHSNTNISNTKIDISNAYDFLLKSNQNQIDVFESQNKKMIQDWDRFIDWFNNTVEQEELKYSFKVLFARLKKLASTWIYNQKNNEPKNNDLKNNQRLN